MTIEERITVAVGRLSDEKIANLCKNWEADWMADTCWRDWIDEDGRGYIHDDMGKDVFCGNFATALHHMVFMHQERRKRPYWLWRAMLEYCAEQPCRRHIVEPIHDENCSGSGDCITEWCVACAARTFLAEIKAREEYRSEMKGPDDD